jgi:hypothetical protein
MITTIPTIIAGENQIVKVNLFLRDGVSPLILSSAAAIKASIRQARKVIAEFTYNEDDEIRQGESESQLLIEIDRNISRQFESGVNVDIYLTVEVANAEFASDNQVQRDISKIVAFTVE